jgi:metal-responsive CopG/Arc/MetJ family transcriptional regulator
MMRTTVTLDDDVAKALVRIAREEGRSPKEIIIAAVRQLVARRRRRPQGAIYKTPTVDLGTCLIGSLDDVQEGLALAEGDNGR